MQAVNPDPRLPCHRWLRSPLVTEISPLRSVRMTWQGPARLVALVILATSASALGPMAAYDDGIPDQTRRGGPAIRRIEPE